MTGAQGFTVWFTTPEVNVEVYAQIMHMMNARTPDPNTSQMNRL
jgi:hypothetical protein